MFKTNEPIKVIHLPKLPNQSMLSGALVVEIVSNSVSESKKNFRLFDKAGNVLIEKKEICAALRLDPFEIVLNLLQKRSIGASFCK